MAHHILVIDDDLDLLEVYRIALHGAGYQVSLSPTVFAEVAELERLHPDLVLLDVKISQAEDGLTQLEQLRAYPPTSTLPVILCTAAMAAATRARVEALRREGVPVVYKPFDLTQLLRTIQRALPPVRGEEEPVG